MIRAVIILSIILLLSLILYSPLENSDCTHEFYTETFQQFKQREDIKTQKILTYYTMAQAIKNYREKKRTKKRQNLTKLTTKEKEK